MIAFLNALMVSQLIGTSVALILNSFLIYVIVNHSVQKYGFYKYIMIMYSIFESIFAVVVLLGLPLHLIADQAWMIFTYEGFFASTSMPRIGPVLYCSLYLCWVVIVCVMFLYRYVVVCRPKLALTIQYSRMLRFVLTTVFIISLGYCCFCGGWLCAQMRIYPKQREILAAEFNITDLDRDFGEIMARLMTVDGEPFVAGIIATLNHYVLILIALLVIGFCSHRIWRKIQHLQNDQTKIVEVKLQRQMFVSLAVQTVVPIIFCHLPAVICLSFPIVKNFSFGPFAPLFTCATTVNKILDPIVLMYFIKDYRRGVRIIGRKLCCKDPLSGIPSAAQADVDFTQETHASFDLNSPESSVVKPERNFNHENTEVHSEVTNN